MESQQWWNQTISNLVSYCNNKKPYFFCLKFEVDVTIFLDVSIHIKRNGLHTNLLVSLRSALRTHLNDVTLQNKSENCRSKSRMPHCEGMRHIVSINIRPALLYLNNHRFSILWFLFILSLTVFVLYGICWQVSLYWTSSTTFFVILAKLKCVNVCVWNSIVHTHSLLWWIYFRACVCKINTSINHYRKIISEYYFGYFATLKKSRYSVQFHK